MNSQGQLTEASIRPSETPPTAKQNNWPILLPWISLLVGVAIVGIVGMPAATIGGDPTMWREETRSILFYQRLSIDPKAETDFINGNEPGQYFVRNVRDGRLYSKYGVVNSLMSIPPMFLQRVLVGRPLDYREPPHLLSYNLWNLSLSVVLAAVLMRLSGLYSSSIPTRLIFVFTSLYCTYLFFYLRAQSSEIYQALFYSTAFLFLILFLRSVAAVGRTGPEVQKLPFNNPALYLMWIFVALMILTRVLYVLLLPICLGLIVLALVGLPRHRWVAAILHVWPPLIIPPIAIVLLLGFVNDIKFGNPLLSGYHQWKPELHLPVGPMLGGLYGLLINPRFSLFLYFPTLMLALLGVAGFARRYPLELLAVLGGLVAFVLALSKIPTWAGEWTYGPRYILFALPVASLPFIVVIDGLINRTRQAPAIGFLAAMPIAMVLCYSAYLQVRVNSLAFFSFYAMRPEYTSPELTRFFDDRPVGMVIDDLQRNRDRIGEMPWFAALERLEGPQRAIVRKFLITRELRKQNYYWWPNMRPR